MRDRIPRDPGRVLITPENGEAYYATMERADNPLQEGDALNKKNLLPDEVAESLGLDPAENPVPADAFEHIAAKGLRIGITVHGGTSAPSNAKNGDIWVNTSTPVKGWAYSFTEPDNPTEGKVWLQASEGVALDTFVDGNITISPISARQYIGGLWVSKEAKTYVNGEWKDWITLLINGADECADVTGGWDSLAVNIYDNASARALSVTTGADYIELAGGGGGYGGIFCTANKIRCTGSTSLRISGEIAAYSDHVQIVALSSKTSAGVVAEWVAPGGTIKAEPKTYNDEAVLDLPAGEYYIAFSIYSTDNQYVRINKLYIANKAGGSIQPGGGGGGGEISAEVIEQAVKNYLEANPIEETDPTVPDWAKQPEKPEYTAEEIGAQPKGEYLTEIPENLATKDFVTEKIAEAELGGEEVDLSDYALKSELPTKTSDLDNDSGFVTAAVATLLNYYLKSETYKKSETYSATEVDNLVNALSARLNAFFDTDDTTLDELSEIVAYIKSNKSLIDSITTSKVNVADIINNLTTSVANKPLSAAQGVALKALIDAIIVPTKLADLAADSTHRTVTDSEKTAWNAKSNFSGNYADLSGKPTIPTVPTKVSAFTNDAGYLTEITDENVKDALGYTPANVDDVFEYTLNPTFTNVLDEVGIEYGKTINASTGELEATVGTLATTGFIQIKSGDVIRMEDFALTATGTPKIGLYNSSKSLTATVNTANASTGTSYYLKDPVLDAGGHLIGFQIDKPSNGFMRISTSTNQIGANPVLTINEEITYEMGYGEKLNPKLKVDFSQVINSPQKNGWSILPYERLNICYSSINRKPINTVEHFIDAATNFGYNALKCDVRPTSDGELVCCHDAGFTFNSSGKITTYDSANSTPIRSVTAATVLGYSFPTGEHPCLVGDYLDVCRTYGKVAFVTIRNEYMDVVIPKLLEELKAHNMTYATIINCMTYESLVQWREQDSNVMINYTLAYDTPITQAQIDKAVGLGYCSLCGFSLNSSNLEPINTCDFEYARANGIRLLQAIAYKEGSPEACYALGYDGCQIGIPWGTPIGGGISEEDVADMINSAIGSAIGGSY